MADERLYIDSVLREHVSLASELLAALKSASLEGTGPASLDDLWSRAEASVDALRADHDQAIGAALAAVPAHPETSSVAALLLAESGADGALPQVTTLLRDASCDIRDAAWWGLRLANIGPIAAELSALAAQPVNDYATATARDCLAFHRYPVVVPAIPTFNALPEDVAWLTTEACGRFEGTWDATQLAHFFTHRSPAVKGTALKNAARAGFRGVVDFCRSAPDDPSMRACIEFLGVVGNDDDLPRLRRLATGADSALARSATAALGKLESIAAITDDSLGAAFEPLPHRLRRAVYLRRRALVPGTPDWELDTWPSRQRDPAR